MGKREEEIIFKQGFKNKILESFKVKFIKI
jgi:hypothetical protein